MLLALFPLQLIVFPGEEVPLHIFEPRYKQLIAECRDEGVTFGIPVFVDGRVSQYGTEVELVKVFRDYDDGEMDIIVRGLSAFEIKKLHDLVPGKLYAGAEIEPIENDPESDPLVQKRLFTLLNRLLILVQRSDLTIKEESENLSFKAAARAGLSLSQRLEVIAMPREKDRQDFVLAHIETALERFEKRGVSDLVIGRNGASRRSSGSRS